MAFSFIKLIILTLYILLFIFIILKVYASVINPTFGPGSPLYQKLQILRSKDIPNTPQYTGKNRNLKLEDASNIIKHVNNLHLTRIFIVIPNMAPILLELLSIFFISLLIISNKYIINSVESCWSLPVNISHC